MKRSVYQEKKLNKLKKEALFLYKKGFSLREVAKLIGKSYEWVRRALPKTVDK